MRIARFKTGDDVHFGVVVTPEAGVITVRELAGHPFGEARYTGREFPLSEVRLLAPVLPSKVVAIGQNYADHAAEMKTDVPDEPLMFLKPSTSVTGPGTAIALPQRSLFIEHEAELAVVIGRLCRDVPEATAADVILGYTCANDVTARDLQAQDGQWTRAKGFDTFCPLGPWIETDLDLTGPDPDILEVTCEVNGEPRQLGTTKEMVHSVAKIVSWVSAVMTLLPGDVILTGTPAGIGPLRAGDVVDVTITGIGSLVNSAVERA